MQFSLKKSSSNTSEHGCFTLNADVVIDTVRAQLIFDIACEIPSSCLRLDVIDDEAAIVGLCRPPVEPGVIPAIEEPLFGGHRVTDSLTTQFETRVLRGIHDTPYV